MLHQFTNFKLSFASLYCDGNEKHNKYRSTFFNVDISWAVLEQATMLFLVATAYEQSSKCPVGHVIIHFAKISIISKLVSMYKAFQTVFINYIQIHPKEALKPLRY